MEGRNKVELPQPFIFGLPPACLSLVPENTWFWIELGGGGPHFTRAAPEEAGSGNHSCLLYIVLSDALARMSTLRPRAHRAGTPGRQNSTHNTSPVPSTTVLQKFQPLRHSGRLSGRRFSSVQWRFTAVTGYHSVAGLEGKKASALDVRPLTAGWLARWLAPTLVLNLEPGVWVLASASWSGGLALRRWRLVVGRAHWLRGGFF